MGDEHFLSLLADAEKREKVIGDLNALVASQLKSARRFAVIGGVFIAAFVALRTMPKFGLGPIAIISETNLVLMAFAGLFLLIALIKLFFMYQAESERRLLIVCNFFESRSQK